LDCASAPWYEENRILTGNRSRDIWPSCIINRLRDGSRTASDGLDENEIHGDVDPRPEFFKRSPQAALGVGRSDGAYFGPHVPVT